jgi:hypothetical protein
MSFSGSSCCDLHPALTFRIYVHLRTHKAQRCLQMTKLPKIWPALLISLLFLAGCGNGTGITPPPVDPSLDWDEGNWDEKEWA